MESFANYLRYARSIGAGVLTTNLIGRNISSTCNSSGSTIWALAKDIKPLVDANCHTEAIELAYHQSPTQFSTIHYRNPGSKSHFPSGDTILFGRPLELCTVGELKTVPPVLGYLLDSVHDWPHQYLHSFGLGADRKQTLYREMGKYWPLVNALEQAWTGVEERDRAIISKLALQGNHRILILVRPLHYTIYEAKCPCRHTFWPCQSRYGQMK